MKLGTGFFLAIGIGLGVGLFAGDNWLWQGLVGIIIITLLHVLTKSEMLINSVNNCKEKNQSFSLGMFFVVNILMNIVIVGIVFTIMRIVKKLF